MQSLTSMLTVLLAGAATLTVSFDRTAPGEMPPGWSVAMTDRGQPPHWEVVRDPTAPTPPNVLAQVSKDPNPDRFPLAILDKPVVKDGEISVRFKAVGGKTDRAAGLVFRYWDPRNYYFVRLNALANDLSMFKMQNGRLTPLNIKGKPPRSYIIRHDIPSNQWGTLKVVFRGPLFSVYLNHRRLLQVQDTSYLGSGKVGLWTQADSVTYFDNFEVKAK